MDRPGSSLVDEHVPDWRRISSIRNVANEAATGRNGDALLSRPMHRDRLRGLAEQAAGWRLHGLDVAALAATGIRRNGQD